MSKNDNYPSEKGAHKKYVDWYLTQEAHAHPDLVRPPRYPEISEETGVLIAVPPMSVVHSMHSIDDNFYAEDLASAAYKKLSANRKIARWKEVCGVDITEEKLLDYMQALFAFKAKTFLGDKRQARQDMEDALFDNAILAPAVTDDILDDVNNALQCVMEKRTPYR